MAEFAEGLVICVGGEAVRQTDFSLQQGEGGGQMGVLK